MTPPRKPDGATLDLFNWSPPDVAPNFDGGRVRARSPKVRAAKALSAALNDAGQSVLQ